MELGQFTLSTFLLYLKKDSTPATDIVRFHLRDCSDAISASHSTGSSILVPNDSDFFARMQNMWAIGRHIVAGLEFMHKKDHVHRDLKPSNGMSSLENQS